MIQRKHADFFERLTQDIAKFFSVLISKNIEDAEEELNLAYSEWLKLDRKTFEELKPEELLATLLEELKLDVSHVEILADLFAKEGEFYFKQKLYLKSKLKLENAVKLFDFVDQEKQVFSFERQATVQNIKMLIANMNSNHLNDNFKK